MPTQKCATLNNISRQYEFNRVKPKSKLNYISEYFPDQTRQNILKGADDNTSIYLLKWLNAHSTITTH